MFHVKQNIQKSNIKSSKMFHVKQNIDEKMFHVKQCLEFLEKSQEELQKFSDFVLKWQKTINLISPSSVNNIWERHIIDSVQLYSYIPCDARVLLDMGSGGGFPAIVLAIVNKQIKGCIEQFYLVESDVKKCVFLQEAARVFQLPVTVLNQRLETVEVQGVDVITARALKPIKELMEFSMRFLNKQTHCLFLKGERVFDELQENPYMCDVTLYPSQTNKNSFIVDITGVQK